MIIHRQWCS